MAKADLQRLNSLSPFELEVELLKCCGSKSWAAELSKRAPFPEPSKLIQESEHIWRALSPDDWMEAFRSHPRIGEQKAAEQVSREAQQWSKQEQSAARSASMETKNELIELNRQYQERFGFIFIVCAAGKSANEILSVLKQRLNNEAAEELRIAANEQAKITELRLAKLINQ